MSEEAICAICDHGESWHRGAGQMRLHRPCEHPECDTSAHDGGCKDFTPLLGESDE